MILSKLKIWRSHRFQSIRDLEQAVVPEPYTGCPVIAPGAGMKLVDKLIASCPTGAISSNTEAIFDGLELAIDLGRCIFCRECAHIAPAHIRFSNNHRMAASRRRDLVVTAANEGMVPFHHGSVDERIRTLFRQALKLREVSAGGDNSCEMELNAAMNVNFDLTRFGIEFVASPRHADALVLTGPITKNMAGPLQSCYDAMPEPKIVIAVGADAISGGLLADSPELDRRFLGRHTPQLFIPGNPAHPLTFIDGIVKLTGQSYDR